MSYRLTIEEAQSRFRELAERVRATREPVVVEVRGEALVALVSIDDLTMIEGRRREEQHVAEFVRLAAEAERERRARGAPDETEEDIVRAVKATREAMFPGAT